MAATSNTCSSKHSRNALSLALLLFVTLSLLQSTHSMQNNRRMCRELAVVEDCPHGSHAPYSSCPENRYCYKGAGDFCQDDIPEHRCSPNLLCRGERCMNCSSKNCFMEIAAKVLDNAFKRFERRMIE